MELLGCGTWRIWGTVSLPFKMSQIHQKSLDSRPLERWWLQNHSKLTALNVAFSADDKRIAILTRNRVTIMYPEKRLSIDPWPKGRDLYRWKAAFPTCNHLVICALLRDNDSDEFSGLLQVWKLKDHSECTSSLDINIDNCPDKYPSIFLAPDGLTVIFTHPVLCYSWNHETAQFDRIWSAS